jgi:ABC-type transport system involved in cytochrome bd biosynthesis fused ATPase/permease subunit
LPGLVAQGVTISLEVLSTAAALIWAAPGAWSIALALTAATLLLPLLAQKIFFEPDMRVQTHAGALSGFILNALLGLTPIRIHGAERSLRRGQEAMLVEWTKSRYWLQRLSVGFEGSSTRTWRPASAPRSSCWSSSGRCGSRSSASGCWS